ncbi:hypothetical protein N0V93_004314 [Gnomoniopsis smithogilvyi]|uniref:Uncharacterized protein n=1 Tax=Gnomoniopsis smithogilvyi TaxID=1191159 RepID=A0A9W8YQV4_9PEZI|nr:hypothetical protein N0V93_004314 [Gnomoniopsis smithogilvyi]
MYHFRTYYHPPPPPVKTLAKMDPDCAICHAPATRACDCEANSLETAIRQAEARAMHNVFNELRSWVRAHAQDYILEYFRLLCDRRKQAHTAHIDRITQHAYHYYNAPPHPSEITAAQTALRHGINEDWQSSVMRYPEVLHYFYSLVDFTLPADDDPAVRDPPLSALRGHRPADKRRGSGGGAGSITPTIASASREFEGRRTPPGGIPTRGHSDRRTPGPQDRRYGRPQPPPHPGYYPQSSYFA